MATLEINGRRVEVDDSFRSLSPEQQQATVEEIAGRIMGEMAKPQMAGADAMRARGLHSPDPKAANAQALAEHTARAVQIMRDEIARIEREAEEDDRFHFAEWKDGA